MQNVLVGSRYRIVEKIGSGGMADVYKAMDETLGRTVAVKLMHTQLSHDPSFTARFQQEAKAAANLQSPYIVNIYDWGAESTSDGTQLYYIVMEYVRGEDLKSIIRRTGALPSAKVAEIGAMMCAALNTAHGYDIIHRDIKPHNIMVLPDGNIKVMDFGIARAGNTQMTQTGSVLGSAHYVSPEQAQGRDLNATSDLYSVGVVLYEASTGRVPFEGDSPVATALKQVQEQAIRPTSLNPNIDPQLEQVIGFAMAKDPRSRYKTADAMRRDLIRVARGEAIVGAHGNADDDATRVMPGVAPLPGRGGPQDIDGTTVMPAVDAGAAPAAAAMGGPRAIEPEPEKKPNKALIWIGIILALAAIAGIVAWQLGVFESVDDPTVVVMPDVTEMTEDAAREELRSNGIAVVLPYDFAEILEAAEGDFDGLFEDVESDDSLIVIEMEYSSTIPPGYVISHTPGRGQNLGTIEEAADTQVTLVISEGEELFEVPDLSGMTLEEARTAVEEAGFTIESTTEYHATVPAGQIFNQNPAAGEERPEGAEIRVVISDGVEEVVVPDVRGSTRARATTALENAGFDVRVETAHHATVSEGNVISQDPLPSEQHPRGGTVTITVSSGPELVAVPNVLNRSSADAITALDNAGFDVTVNTAEGNPGIVLAQEPRGGQRVAPGSNVTITVGEARP